MCSPNSQPLFQHTEFLISLASLQHKSIHVYSDLGCFLQSKSVHNFVQLNIGESLVKFRETDDPFTSKDKHAFINANNVF